MKLTIACIALFVSLGGVSYGVATGFIDGRDIRDNTIKSADVRNGSLRAQDIRNESVRGFDIRDSSIQGDDVGADVLSGDDVTESSLAQVPATAEADNATSVSVMKKLGPTSIHATYDPPVTLVTHGPLTLIADCEREGQGTAARLQVQTTEPGAGAGNVSAPELTPGGPVTIAEVFGPYPAWDSDNTPIFALAGGKALTGEIGLSATAIGAGGYWCSFSGRVVLEG